MTVLGLVRYRFTFAFKRSGHTKDFASNAIDHLGRITCISEPYFEFVNPLTKTIIIIYDPSEAKQL